MPKFTTERPGQLLTLLKKHFPDWKASTLKQRLKHDLVRIDGVPAVSGAERVEAGSVIEILSIPPSPASLFPAGLGEPPLPILYADDDLIAIDKPPGLLSVASEREKNLTAVRLMREWLLGLDPKQGDHHTVHAAHRLDREASGLLLFARSLEIKRALAAAWHTFTKVYNAVTDGVPTPAEGTITTPLQEDKALFVRPNPKGQNAITHYRTLKKHNNRALLEIQIETGKKHQIRVHMASIDCPLVGDLRYGISKAPRLALHHAHLTLTHPATHTPLHLSSPTPPSLKSLLRK